MTSDRDGDSALFGPDTDWENGACLNFARDQWYVYATGYERAAEILVEYVQSHHHLQDTLVYPIVFLCRHHLELLLKRTLVDAQRLLDRPAELPTHHDIERLWRNLLPLVNEIYSDDDPSELNQLRQAIREFSQAGWA